MNRFKTCAAIWRYTKGQRVKFMLAFLLLILELLLSFVTPLVLSVTIDSVIGSAPLSAPWYFTWLLSLCGGLSFIRSHMIIMSILIVVMALLSGLLSFLRPCLTASAAFHTAKTLRDRFYQHVQNLPYRYLSETQTGDLVQRATSDIDTTQRFLSNVMLELLRTVFLLAVGFVLMASLNLPLTLISFAMVPVIIADSLIFVKKIDRLAESFEHQESQVYTVIQENLTGARVVRAFGRERFELDKMQVENEKLRSSLFALNGMLARLWCSLDILTGIQIAAVTIFGIIFTVNGRITLGQYTAFLSYVTIFLMPVQDFGRVLGSFSRALIAAGRVEEILEVPEEDPTTHGLTPPMSGDICFRDVSFSFGDAPVLQHLNLTIHGGETVAILGGTGSGKSTIIQLLERLYEPDSGFISIGGINIQEIGKHYLRDHIGMVMQEPYLYSKTIGANIGIKDAAPNADQITAAAKIACIHEDIMHFSAGYDTVIGERGVTLSGGQKQRVAIARAILEDSDILIFDDALSAVDTHTDQSIRAALKQRRSGVTTIIISHRISTLMEADRIFVLSQGSVAESGTHQQLIQKEDGLYRRVYDIQTRKDA